MSAPPANPRILAIQLKRIGDLLLTTPALAALRARHPGSRLVLCGGPAALALQPALPMVDAVIPWRTGWQGLPDAVSVLGKAAGRGGLTLDFTGTDRSALAAALSLAPLRRSFAWMERKGPRARVYTELVESSVRDRHTVDHYLDLAGGPPDSSAPIPHAVMHIPEETARDAAEFLAGKGVTGEYCVVHPGSARAEKHWPADRWKHLLEELSRGFRGRILLTGSTEPHELRHIQDIVSKLGPSSGRVTDVAGETPLLRLAALIAGARFLVGVDSAAVHFAGGLEVPSVSLYGPTNPYHWRVRDSRAWVALAGRPEPVSGGDDTAFTPRHEARPMSDLSAAAVERALANIFA